MKKSEEKFRVYVFEKWIFRGAVLLLGIVFFIGFLMNGLSEKIYLHCPENKGMCFNPLYDKCEEIDALRGNDVSKVEAKNICLQKFLFPGFTIGVQENNSVKYLLFVDFFILVLAFFFNHLFFNRPNQLRVRRYQKVFFDRAKELKK